MLVRDAPDLEVLMLRRTARTIFAGDMWVYPGGAVDADDGTHLTDWCDGLTDTEASELLGVDTGGLGYWVAAVRECFEEAGVLFSGSNVDPGHDHMVNHRERLNARAVDFADDRPRRSIPPRPIGHPLRRALAYATRAAAAFRYPVLPGSDAGWPDPVTRRRRSGTSRMDPAGRSDRALAGRSDGDDVADGTNDDVPRRVRQHRRPGRRGVEATKRVRSGSCSSPHRQSVRHLAAS